MVLLMNVDACSGRTAPGTTIVLSRRSRRWSGAARSVKAVARIGSAAMACAACSSSAGGAPEPTAIADAPAAVVPADLKTTVDEIVTMLPPAADGRRPDGFALGGGTVLASRPVLRAPDGTGGFVELWILQARMDEQAGGGLQECRALLHPEGLSVTCRGPDAANGPPSLVQLSTGDGDSLTVELSGPDDMTHFVVTAGDRRIALIPIAGEAVLHLDGCPRPASVAAWRGDELMREEPGLMC